MVLGIQFPLKSVWFQAFSMKSNLRAFQQNVQTFASALPRQGAKIGLRMKYLNFPQTLSQTVVSGKLDFKISAFCGFSQGHQTVAHRTVSDGRTNF